MAFHSLPFGARHHRLRRIRGRSATGNQADTGDPLPTVPKESLRSAISESEIATRNGRTRSDGAGVGAVTGWLP